MLGLSPLAAGRRRLFQQACVRPSRGCHPPFGLPAARSPGFGSAPRDCDRPVRTRFRCASAYRLRLAAQGNSLTHYAKGTPSPARDPEGSRRAPTARGHPVSGSLSPPSSGCFSPFPHGTGSLSVAEEYLGLGGGPPAFGQDFTCPALLWGRRRRSPVRACHPLWGGFPAASGSAATAAGLVPVRSPLLGESRLMSFPPGTEMFQFPGFASGAHGFGAGCRAMRGGFPHSETPGSKPARGSPGLVAACRVLHRLSAPRHPPGALLSLAPPRRPRRRGRAPRPLSKPTNNDERLD